MKTTAFILVIALAPGAAFAQVPTGQEEAQQSVGAVDTQQDAKLSADSLEEPKLRPQRLQRTFQLLKQPGFHPELFELLGLESVTKSYLPTAPPAALQTWHWIWIGVGIGVAALFIFYKAIVSDQ